ncbi:hypothetical protein BD408DRAFT_424616 [Parasitella parasitica]|nr:hypothetical protein BD408DRAFT_424616 [Parasitella parasitica]
MNSQVSSQTLFSNLPAQNISSSEFSKFTGMGRFVQEAANGHFDMYNNSSELINLLGQTTAAATATEKPASEKPATQENQPTPVVEFGIQVLFPSSTKKRVYTREQVKELLFLVFESKMTASKASAFCGINSSTAYGYIKQVKDQMATNKTFVEFYAPAKAKTAATPAAATTTAKTGNRKLFDIHFQFLAQLSQNDEFATLVSARRELIEKFPGLQVSTSCIHSNLRQNCALVVKASFDPSSVVKLASSMMFEEEVLVGMTFFTMYLHSAFGWPKGSVNVGEPASARLSGIRVPVLAAITSTGVQRLSVVSPVAVAKEGATDRK